VVAKRTYWFGRKQVGWGISPSSWQGWTVIAIYCASMIFLPRVIDPVAHHGVEIAARVAFTLALLCIMFWKFGPPKED